MIKGVNKKVNSCKQTGFTLIELLIVIAVMAILAAVVFVALDPLARFQAARNNSRWTDINAIVSAIKLYQIDQDGSHITSIGTGITATEYHQIGTDTTGCGGTCNCNETTCNTSDVDLTIQGDCVNLVALVTAGYLPDVPFDPLGDTASADATQTGYYLIKSSTGVITVGSCHEELGAGSEPPFISVKR